MIIEFWKTGENPITCYNSRKNSEEKDIVFLKPKKKEQPKNKQPVLVVFENGDNKEYESVSAAAVDLKINKSTFTAFVNGRGKPVPGITIYKLDKSIINQ